MRIIAITFFLLSCKIACTQTSGLTKEDLAKELQPITTSIKNLQASTSGLNAEILSLKKKIKLANDTIIVLESKIDGNTAAIEQNASQFDSKLNLTANDAKQGIKEIDQSLSKKSLYSIIGVMAAIILSITIYLLLTKRQKYDRIDIIQRLGETKASLEESLVKELGKQTDLLEIQIKLLEQQSKNEPVLTNREPDHSLALKLASEINLIERNISLMDPGTKGLKQLMRSVGKLKDNLAANGYEIPDLLGKQFHQGMKVIVSSSIQDENLEKGSEIITKVLIPQVNFKDKMIQTAQIEVSVGI